MQHYVQIPTSPPRPGNPGRRVFSADKSTAATKTRNELTYKTDTAKVGDFCLQPLNLPVGK